MILVFDYRGLMVYVSVRVPIIYLTSKRLGYEMVALRDFVGVDAKNAEEMRLLEVILRCLPSPEDVESYVRLEFKRLGFTYEGVLSDDDFRRLR